MMALDPALKTFAEAARGFMPVALETGGLLQALRELAATNEKLFNVACIVQAAEDVDLSNEGAFRYSESSRNRSVTLSSMGRRRR